jgi:hypothetical protein
MKTQTQQKTQPENTQVEQRSKTKNTQRAPSTKINDNELTLPVAKDTERELLGVIILEGIELLQKATEAGLEMSLFFIQSHRIIYSACLDIQSRNWTLTPETLQDYLRTQHTLEKIGGPAFIAELLSGRAFGPSAISGLIRQLKDTHYKREAFKKGEELRKMAGNGASPAEIEELLDAMPRTQTVRQSYFLTPNGIWMRKPARGGAYGVENEQVTNFGARIMSEVIADDGSTEEQRIFELEITVKGDIKRIEVPGSKFDGMTWVTDKLGAEARVCPGKKDHAQYAIAQLSPSFSKRTVYAHTGWRKIADDWCYLHGGGAIVGTGNRSDVSVRLPHSLRFFSLPEPAKGDDIIKAYQSVTDLLEACPHRLSIPLMGAVIASIMGDPDYSVYVTGQSGCFKSEITGIMQSFFGSGFNRLTMPANWDDTANVLLSKAFTAKDAAYVIDDFAPNGQKRHDEELHTKAERVFRAAGNRTGRGRLQSDMTERVSKEPRGLLISSGEDLPRGMSLQARLLIVPIEKGEITGEALTSMQKAAAEGKYAISQATFISYLARKYDAIKIQFNKDRISYRNKLSQQSEGHARHATTTAHLAASWRAWLVAAVEENAITTKDAKDLWRKIWKVLTDASRQQKEVQGSLHPVDHFIELFRSALTSGRANLQTIDGDRPNDIDKLCGWRDGRPNGECAGWIDGDIIYLEWDTAYGVANAQGVRNGEGIAVQKRTLTDRLNERGLIMRTEGKRGFKVRTPKTRLPAIAISLHTIFPQEIEETA